MPVVLDSDNVSQPGVPRNLPELPGDVSERLVSEAKMLLAKTRQKRWWSNGLLVIILLQLLVTLLGFAWLGTRINRRADQIDGRLERLEAAVGGLRKETDETVGELERGFLETIKGNDASHEISRNKVAREINARIDDIEDSLMTSQNDSIEWQGKFQSRLDAVHGSFCRFVRSRREVVVIYAMHSSEPVNAAAIEPLVDEISYLVSGQQQLFAWNKEIQRFDGNASVTSPNSPDPMSWLGTDIREKATTAPKHLLVITNRDTATIQELAQDSVFRICSRLTVVLVHDNVNSPASANWTEFVKLFDGPTRGGGKLSTVSCKVAGGGGQRKRLDDESLDRLVKNIEAAIIPWK